MRLANLTTEHPTLAATAAELLAHVDRWSDEVRSAQGASAWVHHVEFARRTERLAGHLKATLALAEEDRFPSAFAVARTALEHHLLDRLLLLADRYEEIVRPLDPELLEEWEQAWVQRTEEWTRDFVSVERVRNGRALRLVQLGHKMRDDAGNVREQISPYWVATEHYDAFLGHPDIQALTVHRFDSLDERVVWAKRNQALYGAFLRWGSICSNLELSHLASRAEIVQLQVHYAFLSAFAHATKAGYEVDRQPYPNSPPASHVLGELALLYVATIAVSELRSWAAYLERRPHLLAPLSSTITELASRAADVIAYFWFLGGHPPAVRLLPGGQPPSAPAPSGRSALRDRTFAAAARRRWLLPEPLRPPPTHAHRRTGDDDRVRLLSPLVLASLVEAVPRATRWTCVQHISAPAKGRKMACCHQLAAIANGPLAANHSPVAAST